MRGGLPWVTSRLPKRVSATAGVPQIAADMLQRHGRSPWAQLAGLCAAANDSYSITS
jgi:hypothetical protein